MTVKYYKLICYVPTSHIELVKKALFSVGCGRVGDYSHCGWTAQGVGQFIPNTVATPFIGQAGDVSYVDELRFETLVRANCIRQAVAALVDAHPYEEPAYDIVALVTLEELP
ncbi:MAG: NGG1p interacting factor NIF3 [Legionellales bacterium]|nr:NGG1p interacting factor NIF3 [Legionellales bacterium]|tara:strand:- start:915 stop:1250 length:336 start_codon:yes stop_codon:yes gene_type:complete